jgi:hypothetical protein
MIMWKMSDGSNARDRLSERGINLSHVAAAERPSASVAKNVRVMQSVLTAWPFWNIIDLVDTPTRVPGRASATTSSFTVACSSASI